MNRSTRTLALSRPSVHAKALRMLLGTLAVALAASISQTALAQPAGPMDGGMHGRHMGPGGHGGPGGMMGGRHVGRMLDLVNATPDQRSQIKAIMDAAHTDLKAQREAGRTLRQQMQAAFAQPTVDARAVEALRVQIQAQHDAASKRMTQAMLDASKVLTPEQRKTLADAMAKRQALMQRHAAERAALEKPAAK